MEKRQSGTIDGVSFEIVEGLVSFRVEKHQADDVVKFLQDWIRKGSREENPTPDSLLNTMRAAYLAYQLQTECRLSDLDASDVDLLYCMRITTLNNWFFNVVNDCKNSLRRLDNRIPMAMVAARSIHDVMSQ